MTYRITASSAMGVVGLNRDNAAGALKKARELQAEAYMDVRVIDPEGVTHEVEAFAQIVEGQG